MEVQSVINESALKEARKYLIKPGIRKISAIASAAFVLPEIPRFFSRRR